MRMVLCNVKNFVEFLVFGDLPLFCTRLELSHLIHICALSPRDRFVDNSVQLLMSRLLMILS